MTRNNMRLPLSNYTVVAAGESRNHHRAASNYGRCFAIPFPSGALVASIERFREQHLPQHPQRLDHARSRPVEVLIAVRHENAILPDRAQIAPAGTVAQPVHLAPRALEIVAA